MNLINVLKNRKKYKNKNVSRMYDHESVEDVPKIDTKTYQLSDQTKANVSRTIGLPFEKIVNMDVEDLEKHIEQKKEKKTTCDLRIRVDGIPIDQEHIVTMEQVDKKIDEITNEHKLVLKRKNNNK